MNNSNEPQTDVQEEQSLLQKPFNRRFFMQAAGVTAAGAALVMAGCKKDDDDNNTPSNPAGTVTFQTGDTGILNYAYALEQLEAGFYTTVVADAAFTTTFPDATERQYLQDIRDHEILHRELFKTALGNNAIQALTPDFSKINFKDRTSVLTYAQTFEDLGVAAYNGAGKYITDTNNLVLAGKIVSVEARHASYIHALLKPNSNDFANSTIVDANGMEKSKTFSEVLAAAQPFVKQTLNGSNLGK